ncbi:MAG: agmatinase [Candidatus Cloacimonas sp. SDB]|nr:MAG: agmatinase [Candidatus Cloacimonas sp. SDB]
MNFGDLPETHTKFAESQIVILPVPYDGTSTWLKGANKGPQAILEASANLELYDIETDSEVYLQGIHTLKPVTEATTPESMYTAVLTSVISLINQKKFIVTIGGEHSISTGAIEAHAQNFNDLTVLQLDAHADLRPEYDGSKYNHACVMSRVNELGLPFTQVGIRSMDVSEKKQLKAEKTFFAKDIVKQLNWQKKIIPTLSQNVYITIDLDVFDPAIMPSTGTPEPGGLDWWSVLELLRLVAQNRNIVGFDLVELCPDPNHKAPDFLAAKLIYKLLSYKFGEIK